MFVASNESKAEHLGANIHALFPDCPVLVFPRWDCLPYDKTGPSREIMGRRMSVLRRLAMGLNEPLVIATVDALLQRVPPGEIWPSAMLRVEPGRTTLRALRGFFERTGYTIDMLVDEPGEAVIHGQVVDVFPAGALGPVRIDHDGQTLSRIFSYDPASQRTLDELPETTLNPASEFLGADRGAEAGVVENSPWLSRHYPQLQLVFDYMPKATVLLENQNGAASFERIREAYESSKGTGVHGGVTATPLPSPDELYCAESEWHETLRKRRASVVQVEIKAEMRVPVFAIERSPVAAYRRFVGGQVKQRRRTVRPRTATSF